MLRSGEIVLREEYINELSNATCSPTPYNLYIQVMLFRTSRLYLGISIHACKTIVERKEVTNLKASMGEVHCMICREEKEGGNGVTII